MFVWRVVSESSIWVAVCFTAASPTLRDEKRYHGATFRFSQMLYSSCYSTDSSSHLNLNQNNKEKQLADCVCSTLLLLTVAGDSSRESVKESTSKWELDCTQKCFFINHRPSGSRSQIWPMFHVAVVMLHDTLC